MTNKRERNTMSKLTRFTITPALLGEWLQSKNPAVVKGAESLEPMVKRHSNNNFQRGLDLQDIEDANFYLAGAGIGISYHDVLKDEE